MVSTLKLTKIQIPNSDSDVISLDASTGNITLNKTLGGTSITVQGEGTATTNLQQGLCKAWTSVNSNGTFSTHDSFNQSSATDNGTGDHTTTYTTSFSSAKGSPCLGHTSNVINTTTGISGNTRGGTLISQHLGLTQATGSYTFQVYYGATASSDGNFTDLDAVWVARLGDLA